MTSTSSSPLSATRYEQEEGPRFFQREDGAWCVFGESRPDPYGGRKRLPPEPTPLEWDRVALKRCIDRYESLVEHDERVKVRRRAQLETWRAKGMFPVPGSGKWQKATPELDAEWARWAEQNWSEEPMKLIAEEYWMRVANAIILAGE